jgi:predicted flap endonuclease-1-like 5' DNA nuclease
MNESIRNVEGIGDEYQCKLEYIGIKTVSELLAKSQTEEERSDIAERSGIAAGYIDNWATMLDLTRVDGIGYQFAELLTYAGVKSVEDFRKRNPQNLYKTIHEINLKKNFSGTVPGPELLADLIEKSKEITNVIERY